jgi:hypothetical protein
MTRWLSILGVALAVMAWTTDTGCGGGSPPPQGGMTTVGDVQVVYNSLGGVHTYGSTSCPQPVGTFVMTNDGSGPVTVDVTETSGQLDVFLYDPETDSEIPWTPQELPAGASVEVHLRFNCSSTTDIATKIGRAHV